MDSRERARREMAEANDKFQDEVMERERNRRAAAGVAAHVPQPGESDQEWSRRMDDHLRKRAQYIDHKSRRIRG